MKASSGYASSQQGMNQLWSRRRLTVLVWCWAQAYLGLGQTQLQLVGFWWYWTVDI